MASEKDDVGCFSNLEVSDDTNSSEDKESNVVKYGKIAFRLVQLIIALVHAIMALSADPDVSRCPAEIAMPFTTDPKYKHLNAECKPQPYSCCYWPEILTLLPNDPLFKKAKGCICDYGDNGMCGGMVNTPTKYQQAIGGAPCNVGQVKDLVTGYDGYPAALPPAGEDGTFCCNNNIELVLRWMSIKGMIEACLDICLLAAIVLCYGGKGIGKEEKEEKVSAETGISGCQGCLAIIGIVLTIVFILPILNATCSQLGTFDATFRALLGLDFLDDGLAIIGVCLSFVK
jgi:hypothetical protein